MRIAVWMVLVSSSLLGACSGLAEQRLRSSDGRLAPCKGPHCVSSMESDPARRVTPLVYTVSPVAAQTSLVTIIKAMPRATVENQQPGYVHAVFESALFGYKDDVEFLFAPGNRIDLRSSARVGYYDFDANRKRIEAIRAEFDRTQP